MDSKWVGAAKGNFRPGRGIYKPFAVVVHLMDGTLAGTDAWFSNPEAQVSAHVGIGRKGEIHQYVRDEDTAYHAGRVQDATWLPALVGPNPNVFTLSIENEGKEVDDWTPEMVRANAEVIAAWAKKHKFPIDRFHVVGHHEIYAVKPCPGSKCPLDEIVALARTL